MGTATSIVVSPAPMVPVYVCASNWMVIVSWVANVTLFVIRSLAVKSGPPSVSSVRGLPFASMSVSSHDAPTVVWAVSDHAPSCRSLTARTWNR